jgi:hypothetical protein
MVRQRGNLTDVNYTKEATKLVCDWGLYCCVDMALLINNEEAEQLRNLLRDDYDKLN